MAHSIMIRAVLTTSLFMFIFLLILVNHLWDLRPYEHGRDHGRSRNELQHKPKPTPVIGIGFDLTASYGTVALAFPNGTTVAAGKVEAQADYHEMMKRLTLKSSQHQAPPFQKPLETWGDWKRHQARSLRKRLGLPASSDVGILANLISALKAKAETQLNHSISAAVAVTPHPIALYQEDLDDALEHCGLKSPFFEEYPSVGPLIEDSIAAYVGYGRGICANEFYTNWTACQADLEQRGYPKPVNLTTVLFTDSVLSWSQTRVSDIHHQYGGQQLLPEDFAVGMEHEEGDYWTRVRAHLSARLDAYWEFPNVLLVIGENTQVRIFRYILRSVVERHYERVPDYLDGDPLFAAAKGAAELAKRKPFDPSNWSLYYIKDVETAGGELR